MVNAVLNRLLNLKVAKDRKGMAPNKPLLVLAIMDLDEAGLVSPDGAEHGVRPLLVRGPNTGSGRSSLVCATRND